MADSELPSTSRAVRAAYRLWSSSYERETAVSLLEDRAVAGLGVSLEGRALLDAGCGIGRRLAAAQGVRAGVGVDLVPEMLAAGRERWPALALAAGDLRALPLRDAAFDVVWCRLALGHLPQIGSAYLELARVARLGAELIVTDFHPEAAGAGHRRTFRDAEGRLHDVEHHVHTPEQHERAARAAGCALAERRDAPVGPLIRDFYAGADRLDLYQQQQGLPLVLLLRFRKG